MTQSVRVHIQGAGAVGKCVAKGLRRAGWKVHLRAARRPIPPKVDADIVLFAVRDSQLSEYVKLWSIACETSRGAVVLHCAGSLGPEILEPLSRRCKGTGQWHPLVSITRATMPHELHGSYAVIAGNPAARALARTLAKALEMRVAVVSHLDRAAYHTAALIMAAGSMIAHQAAQQVLVVAGFRPTQARKMLGPLANSVTTNVQRLGLPKALTGPTRRGDVETVLRHVALLSAKMPHYLPLYAELLTHQLAMARQLAEADDMRFEQIEAVLKRLCEPRSRP